MELLEKFVKDILASGMCGFYLTHDLDRVLANAITAVEAGELDKAKRLFEQAHAQVKLINEAFNDVFFGFILIDTAKKKEALIGASDDAAKLMG